LPLHHYSIASHDSWLEEAGEVELIGGWAEVALAEEFAAAADTEHYQVFLTSYDAVLVFVQNRTPKGFEIHALSEQSRKPPRSMCCAYRVMARRLRAASPDGC
jgi:hypothetical protein